ncbi:MAG TPA: OmpH family outer membrane protein [Draconibacterium sp.]|nr:OmpH family outer membrane protein [Draconibacterium sp.]
MKGTSLIVSIVLFVAVAVLYFFYFTDSDSGESGIIEKAAGNPDSGSLRIAYVKADSVILNYDLAQDLHDDFTKKQEAYTSEYGTKRQSFEKDAADFQEKVQRGGFLTEQRAVQERDRLVGRQQEISKLDQELSTKLADMQAANNKQILDSLLNYLKEYNIGKKYDYILNGADVLIGNDASNITAEVLKALNERYSGKSKSK